MNCNDEKLEKWKINSLKLVNDEYKLGKYFAQIFQTKSLYLEVPKDAIVLCVVSSITELDQLGDFINRYFDKGLKNINFLVLYCEDDILSEYSHSRDNETDLAIAQSLLETELINRTNRLFKIKVYVASYVLRKHTLKKEFFQIECNYKRRFHIIQLMLDSIAKELKLSSILGQIGFHWSSFAKENFLKHDDENVEVNRLETRKIKNKLNSGKVIFFDRDLSEQNFISCLLLNLKMSKTSC